MSQNNGRVKRSEKGLLTPDNCVVAFIDHQPQMLFGISNFDRQSIINSTVALAKATRIFDMPSCVDHGRNQELQRQHVAAAQGDLSRSGAHRTLLHELLG